MSDTIDLEHLERRLLDERRQTLETLQQAEAEASEGQRQSSGALSRVPTHVADAASDTQEEEKDLANVSRASDQLAEIDEALRRLREEPEAYQTCARCGRKIEPARLELVPWTRLCASCARAVEAEAEAAPAR